MIYGYARISTNKQDISRQIRNMIAFDKHIKIYQEVFTGTKTTARGSPRGNPILARRRCWSIAGLSAVPYRIRT